MASLVASTDGLVPRPDRPSVRDKLTEVPWSVADDAFVAGMERSLSGAALAGDAEARKLKFSCPCSGWLAINPIAMAACQLHCA